jgi:hypothetical protein
MGDLLALAVLVASFAWLFAGQPEVVTWWRRRKDGKR